MNRSFLCCFISCNWAMFIQNTIIILLWYKLLPDSYHAFISSAAHIFLNYVHTEDAVWVLLWSVFFYQEYDNFSSFHGRCLGNFLWKYWYCLGRCYCEDYCGRCDCYLYSRCWCHDLYQMLFSKVADILAIILCTTSYNNGICCRIYWFMFWLWW